MKIKKYVPVVLFVISVSTTVFHLLSGVSLSQEQIDRMLAMNLTMTSMYLVVIPSIIATGLLFFRSTFQAGCLMKATTLFSLSIVFLLSGNHNSALAEIPFISIPLAMIYFGYPFFNKSNNTEKPKGAAVY